MEEAWVAIVGLFYLGLFSLSFYDSMNRVESVGKENYLVKIAIRESKEGGKPKPKPAPKPDPVTEHKSKPLTSESIKEDAISALRNLGCKKKEAVELVNGLADKTKYDDIGELLKDILKKV